MSDEIKAELVKLLPRLRRFAVGLTGNQEDADDLVQIACERALTRLDQWAPGTRLDSWMFRIVQTVRIDDIRRSRRRGRSADPGEIEAAADPGAHRVGEGKMMLSQVTKALERLPPEQRAVLALVGVEQYSYKEAAELLSIPIGTVMSRLARARLRLQELLGESPDSQAAGGR
ncbi:MAG: RNA polymerase sigma factor [Thiohalocapsa sp.]|nr:RNA polymerase sigma factor [Thiohalocapsa sp.]